MTYLIQQFIYNTQQFIQLPINQKIHKSRRILKNIWLKWRAHILAIFIVTGILAILDGYILTSNTNITRARNAKSQLGGNTPQNTQQNAQQNTQPQNSSSATPPSDADKAKEEKKAAKKTAEAEQKKEHASKRAERQASRKAAGLDTNYFTMIKNVGGGITDGVVGSIGNSFRVIGYFFAAIAVCLLVCVAPLGIFYFWMRKLTMPYFKIDATTPSSTQSPSTQSPSTPSSTHQQP